MNQYTCHDGEGISDVFTKYEMVARLNNLQNVTCVIIY